MCRLFTVHVFVAAAGFRSESYYYNTQLILQEEARLNFDLSYLVQIVNASYPSYLSHAPKR